MSHRWTKPGADGINVSAIQGEPGTGFEKAGDLGEFECGNCKFMRDAGCHQPDMMAKSKEPRLKDGSVKVDEEDCCEYVKRVGRKKKEKDEGLVE